MISARTLQDVVWDSQVLYSAQHEILDGIRQQMYDVRDEADGTNNKICPNTFRMRLLQLYSSYIMYLYYVHLSLCTLSFYIISFHITVIYRTTGVDETRLLSTSANVDSRIDVTELWNSIYRRTNSQLSLELSFTFFTDFQELLNQE